MKNIKHDQESTYLQHDEHKSYDMMDKLFRFTQERNKAIEDRLSVIEQESMAFTKNKVNEFENRIQTFEMSLRYPENNIKPAERAESNGLSDRVQN